MGKIATCYITGGPVKYNKEYIIIPVIRNPEDGNFLPFGLPVIGQPEEGYGMDSDYERKHDLNSKVYNGIIEDIDKEDIKTAYDFIDDISIYNQAYPIEVLSEKKIYNEAVDLIYIDKELYDNYSFKPLEEKDIESLLSKYNNISIPGLDLKKIYYNHVIYTNNDEEIKKDILSRLEMIHNSEILLNKLNKSFTPSFQYLSESRENILSMKVQEYKVNELDNIKKNIDFNKSYHICNLTNLPIIDNDDVLALCIRTSKYDNDRFLPLSCLIDMSKLDSPYYQLISEKFGFSNIKEMLNHFKNRYPISINCEVDEDIDIVNTDISYYSKKAFKSIIKEISKFDVYENQDFKYVKNVNNSKLISSLLERFVQDNLKSLITYKKLIEHAKEENNLKDIEAFTKYFNRALDDDMRFKSVELEDVMQHISGFDEISSNNTIKSYLNIIKDYILERLNDNTETNKNNSIMVLKDFIDISKLYNFLKLSRKSIYPVVREKRIEEIDDLMYVVNTKQFLNEKLENLNSYIFNKIDRILRYKEDIDKVQNFRFHNNELDYILNDIPFDVMSSVYKLESLDEDEYPVYNTENKEDLIKMYEKELSTPLDKERIINGVKDSLKEYESLINLTSFEENFDKFINNIDDANEIINNYSNKLNKTF